MIDLRQTFSINARQCRFGDETTIGDKTEVYTQVSQYNINQRCINVYLVFSSHENKYYMDLKEVL